MKDQQSERQLISRMLSNHPVDFLWNTGSEWPGWPSQDNKTMIFNRYCRAGFTSKVSRVTSIESHNYARTAHRTRMIHASKEIDCLRWACARTSSKCTGTTRLEWQTPSSHDVTIFARAIRCTLSSRIFGEKIVSSVLEPRWRDVGLESNFFYRSFVEQFNHEFFDAKSDRFIRIPWFLCTRKM